MRVKIVALRGHKVKKEVTESPDPSQLLQVATGCGQTSADVK